MNVHNQNELLNQHISKLQTEFILIDHGLCPDWSRDTHRRRRDSIYLILDGKGKIVINGTAYYPTKNNMVLLPKNSLVSLYSENETCYNKYWCEFVMHFNGVSLFDMFDFPYVVELEDITYAKSLLDKLDELHLKTDIASALMLKALLLELVALFLERDTRHSETVLKIDPFVEEVKSFLSAHLDERLSVKRLADMMCFNEKYFISLFKKHFGSTPAQYIKLFRLEKAKSMLLYTDEKVSGIISKIGYANPQKFSKDFKEYTNFSPTQFRKSLK
jgi:AraC family transcriptional regulator of arabinose operon